MEIQTLNREYIIVRVLDTNKDFTTAVCKAFEKDKWRLYTVISIKNPDIIYRIVPLFMEQRDNYKFSDYIECFTLQNELYLVFNFTEKPCLNQLLSEDEYSIDERLIIGKNLISRITLLNIPYPVMLEALAERNIVMDRTLNVSFNYFLENFEGYGSATFEKVQSMLGSIYRFLFKAELNRGLCPELNIFVEKLEKGAFADYIDIYRHYDRFYDEMLNILVTTDAQPQNPLFAVWEKLKRATSYIKPVLAGVLILAAIMYFIYSILNPPKATVKTDVNIQQIGTVSVE